MAAEASQLHAQLLQRAAAILGGSEQLESFLNVSETRLRIWERGIAPLPDGVFLKLVDLVIEHPCTYPETAGKTGAPS